MKKLGVRWITSTAVFVAMLVGVQLVTAPFGQLVTGSLVNLILIVSVMLYGIPTGVAVALISPVAAHLIGIGPNIMIVPFIMAGNSALVVIWRLVCRMSFASKPLVRVIALLSAAICKFAILYTGIVLILVPHVLNLPEQQSAVISNLFAAPQLLTASLGGAAAIAILPIIERARTTRTL